ncbi:hypothetical protein [Porphyromonas macacae]|uniref:hypothetical protein n=1 Tax=Porphyromonas macacae TaxID=28115 RepID=UPI0035A01DD3
MDALLHEMSNKIEELRQSKENQDQVYSLQKISLEEERKKLTEDFNREKKTIQQDIKKFTDLLDKKQSGEDEWEAYKDREFKKKQRVTRHWFYGSLIIAVLVMGATFLSQNLQLFLNVYILSNRVVCYLGGILLSVAEMVIVRNYINWNFIPSTEKDFKSNLKRPEYLK